MDLTNTASGGLNSQSACRALRGGTDYNERKVHDHNRKDGVTMTWTKPEFDTIELASEITCYRYSR